MNRLKLLEVTQKINWIASDIIFFCFQEFFNKLENPNYINENIERIY